MKSWDVGNMQEQIDDFMRNWKKIKKSSIIMRGSAYHVCE